MTNLVSRFVKDESGATAIEYGLIAAGISVAIIAVVQGLGSKLKTAFQAGLGQPEVIQRRLSQRCEGSGDRRSPFRFFGGQIHTEIPQNRRRNLPKMLMRSILRQTSSSDR